MPNISINLSEIASMITGFDYFFGISVDPILYHPNHGKGSYVMKEAEILPGIYEIRPQIEYTHDGMRQIID